MITPDDIYARLESLSKILEGSGVIDELEHPDAYSIILETMNLVHAQQARIDELMFEYCSDEISPEQLAEYEQHQKADTP